MEVSGAVVLDAGRRDLPESQPPARPSCAAVDLKPSQSGLTVAKGEWIGSRTQPAIGKIRNIFLNKARIAASIGPKGTIQPQKRRGASERPCGPLWPAPGACGPLWPAPGACGPLWPAPGACGPLWPAPGACLDRGKQTTGVRTFRPVPELDALTGRRSIWQTAVRLLTARWRLMPLPVEVRGWTPGSGVNFGKIKFLAPCQTPAFALPEPRRSRPQYRT